MVGQKHIKRPRGPLQSLLTFDIMAYRTFSNIYATQYALQQQQTRPHTMQCIIQKLVTHPSALIRNPSCNPLTEHEAYNEADDLREESANATLNDGDSHTVAKTQQRDNAAPVDVAITEQPVNPQCRI